MPSVPHLNVLHAHLNPMIAFSFGSPVQAWKYGDGEMDPCLCFGLPSLRLDLNRDC